ncbi:right-handed parallel beta-helix repeat-containing protein [Stieleria marina]|uniref:right-handed parallel beta-helix repeat-containing protein n=1 Tax=Stieleria marina TaxID=1930275 RepID=UPI003AF3F8AB
MLATVVVDTLDDRADQQPLPINLLIADPGADGKISLREAIDAANTTIGHDTITFSPTLIGTLDVTLLPNITESVTILGEMFSLGEHKISIDADDDSRIFNIEGAGSAVGNLNVHISNLTLQNGRTEFSNSNGGAIRFVSTGTLTLENSIIRDNETRGKNAKGGGVYSQDASSTIRLTQGTLISKNKTTGDAASGGGVFSAGEIVVDDSDVIGNTTSGYAASGGGLASQTEVRLINNAQVNGNSTNGRYSQGGGIYAGGSLRSDKTPILGNVYVSSSEVDGNSTLTRFSKGGGIFANDVQITDNSFVRNNYTNSRLSSGGGIYALGNLKIHDSELADNSTRGGVSKAAHLACNFAVNLLKSAPLIGLDLIIPVPVVDVAQTLYTAFAIANSNFDFVDLDPCPATLGSGGSGGGAFARTIEVRNSEIMRNYTDGNSGQGGGLFASLSIDATGSTFMSNWTEEPGSHGGALAVGGKKDKVLGEGVKIQSNPFIVVANSSFKENRTEGTNSDGAAVFGGDGSVISISNSLFNMNQTEDDSSDGGAIAGYTVTLNDTVVTDNSTLSSNSNGGAIDAVNANIYRSVLSSNATKSTGNAASGGAIAADKVTIVDSVFRDNSTKSDTQIISSIGSVNPAGGGAIHARTSASISGSLFDGNSTSGARAHGGAVYSEGTVTTVESTFVDNSVEDKSRFLSPGVANGGAIFAERSIETTRSTITGNRAGGSGGGLFAVGGGVLAEGAVFDPDSVSVTTRDSVIVGNAAIDAGNEVFTVALNRKGSSIIGQGDQADDIVQTSRSGSGRSVTTFLVDGVFDETTSFKHGGISFQSGVLDDNGGLSVGCTDQPGLPLGDCSTLSIDTVLLLPDLQNLGVVPNPTSPVVTTALEFDDTTNTTTLREAIAFVDADPNDAFSEVTFNLGVPRSRIQLSSEIIVQHGLTITGPLNKGITLDANFSSRIFHFESENADVEIANLSLVNGSTIDDNESGGTIRFDSTGTLTLKNSVIRNSRTFGENAKGGSIAASDGTVAITNSSISQSSTRNDNADGGAIYANIVHFSDDSLVSEARTEGAYSDGGAVWANDVTLEDSILELNSTRGYYSRGGAVFADEFNAYSSSMLRNVTQADRSRGGGVYADYVFALESSFLSNSSRGNDAPGGAILARELLMFDSNVSFNFTLGDRSDGGGVVALIDATAFESSFSENSTRGNESDGGAIAAPTLLLSNSQLRLNHTSGNGASGGAINSTVYASITESSITENYTNGNSSPGGGLSTRKSVVIESSIDNNRTLGDDSPGGGISSIAFGLLDFIVADSSVSNNKTKGMASFGGGISSERLTMINATVANNSTQNVNAAGGGVYSSFLALIDNSTISGNHTSGAYSQGGGMLVHRGYVVQSTLSGNSTGSDDNSSGGAIFAVNDLVLENTLSLGNYAAGNSGHEITAVNLSFGGNNIVGSNTTAFDANVNSNVNNANPDAVFASTQSLRFDSDGDGFLNVENALGFKNGELKDNGGRLKSIALMATASNPATDAGDDSQIPTDDQDLDNDGDTTEPVPFDIRGVGRQVDLSQATSNFAATANAFVALNISASGSTVDIGSSEVQTTIPETKGLVVTTLDDVEFDFDHKISLREAIAFSQNGDVITFDPSLADGTIVLSSEGESLSIDKTLLINASDAGHITIDAAGASRVIDFTSPTGDLAINAISLTGGNVASEPGGAIRFQSSGDLTISNSQIFDNRTTGEGAHGGAIYATGPVNLQNVTLHNNSTDGFEAHGGALFATESAFLTNATVTDNETSNDVSNGGALHADTITLVSSTIVGNTANGVTSLGGAFFANNATVRNSIVLSNQSASLDANADELFVTGVLAFEGNNIAGSSGSTFGVLNTNVQSAKADDVFLTTELVTEGALPTLPLLASTTNPALDAGIDALNPSSFDARGLLRLVDLPGFEGVNQIDLGAYELQLDTEELPSLHVTTASDVVDPNDFATSLREAVFLANTVNIDADGDGLTHDTITFAQGVTEATLTSQLPLTSSLTVSGNGPDATIINATGTNQRIFDITDNDAGAIDIIISDLTITGGGRSDAPHFGGAILNRENLSIENVVLHGNAGSLGGAIFQSGEGTLAIINSIIEGNSATEKGGGLHIEGSEQVLIDGVEFSANTSGLDGGGIAGTGSRLTIRNSTFDGNTAERDGGGIQLESTGTVEIVQATLSGNSAKRHGGGLASLLPLSAGTVESSTLTGNRGDSDGDGVGQAGGFFDSFPTLALHNSIVAANFKGTANSPSDIESGVGLGSSHNLIGTTATFVTLTDGVDGNIVGVNGLGTRDATTIFAGIDPISQGGALANNGGRVRTVALSQNPNNPALDHGDDSRIFSIGDAADRQRKIDLLGIGVGQNTVDLGAVEAAEIAFVVTQLTDENDLSDTDVATFDPSDLSLREAIALSNSTPGIETILFEFDGVGPHVMNVASQLPTISAPVVINGTLTNGFIDAPIIQLNANGIVSDGLRISTNDVTIKGLSVTGFANDGIEIREGAGHTIADNWLGLDPAGVASGNRFGLKVGNSTDNLIDGNVISGNTGTGVFVTSTAAENTFRLNKIGTDPIGDSPRPNVDAGMNVIGTGNFVVDNQFSGNGKQGLIIAGAANTVQGNLVGTDAAGSSALANGAFGILVQSDGNLIGGSSTEGQGNVISGNIRQGLLLNNADNNTVRGNLVGVDVTGTAAIANTSYGIYVLNSDGNEIGGSNLGDANIVSGNGGSGVAFARSNNNTLRDNNVGTDLTGQNAVPNNAIGVILLAGASDNLVVDNLISGNTASGLALIGIDTQNNTIDGNHIGFTEGFTDQLANGLFAVLVSASNNVIDGNTIGASTRGVVFTEAGARNNVLSNNSISGNTTGVQFAKGARDNIVGPGNQIFFNDTGVRFLGNSGSQNTITQNILQSNTIGIDLAGPGPSSNDLNDADEGPNRGQNHPELQSAFVNGNNLNVNFNVPTLPANAAYPLTIEVFRSDSLGQGAEYLGSVVYNFAAFNVGNVTRAIPAAVSAFNLSPGDFISATATDADGNTSEFSAAVQISAAGSSAAGNADPVSLARSALDVSGNGEVTPLDILMVLNDLSERAHGELTDKTVQNERYDVNGDGHVTPGDALEIINFLSTRANDRPELESLQFANLVDQIFALADDDKTDLEESLLF